jgi:HSP20 family protein
MTSSVKSATPQMTLHEVAQMMREGWIVKVELAGVSLEDVEIDIQGDTLYIAGTRRDGDCGDCVTYHQLEITYSRFEKTLKFPRSIDGAKLEYNYQDGLLMIHLRSSVGEEKSEAAAK